ncbi:MAG: methylenetetrahydrofolate reductase, partial [bacterium]
HGLEAMCHFTCVGKSRDEVRAILGELQAGGVENIIALRGDPPKGEAAWRPHPDGLRYSIELVREAKAHGGFSIAVAGFPETHPEAASPEADIAYLKEKVDAGADAVVTQFFFDNADFLRFRDRAVAAGVRVPIVPGILPVKSAAWVRKFAPLCKAKVPAELEAALTRLAGDEAGTIRFGVEFAAHQLRGLLAAGIPGYPVYSLNDPRPLEALLEAVGAA